jgi:Tfp pilus assembly protein PilN
MTRVNLIPPETLERSRAGQRLRWWVRRLLAVTVALGMLYGLAQRLTVGPSEAVGQMREDAARLQEAFSNAVSLVPERDRVVQRWRALGSIGEDPPAGWFLAALGEALPPQSYLSNLALDREIPAAAESRGAREEVQGAGRLEMRGYATGHPQVGQIISNLYQSGAFTDVHLISVTHTTAQVQGARVEFEVHCRLAEAPHPSPRASAQRQGD